MSDDKQPRGEGEDSPAHDVDADDAAQQLGPQPDGTTQDPELFPGGPDAVRDSATYGQKEDEPLTRDLDPDDNPAVTDATPDDIKQADDKQQESDGKDQSDPESDEPSA